MEKKFWISAKTERQSLEAAVELHRKLARLGIDASISEVDIVTDLLALASEKLPKLGAINLNEFTELMEANGRNALRARQLWGTLYRMRDFMHDSEEPLYKVDEEAIRAKARPESRASRKHFERVVSWEQHMSRASMDLPAVYRAVQDGTITEEISIGPISQDDLTMVLNTRIQKLAEQDASAE